MFPQIAEYTDTANVQGNDRHTLTLRETRVMTAAKLPLCAFVII